MIPFFIRLLILICEYPILSSTSLLCWPYVAIGSFALEIPGVIFNFGAGTGNKVLSFLMNEFLLLL